MSANRLLVPVSESVTLRQTVEYAVSTALEDGAGTVRFVYVHPSEVDDDRLGEDSDGATKLLRRVEVWAHEDAGDHEADLTVETGTLAADRYIFSPEELAVILAEETRAHDCGRLVLDPEYDPGIGAPLLRPLEYELARFEHFAVEEAPVAPRTQRSPLMEQTSALQIGAIFGLSFVFYQVLGGTFDVFDLVTGAVSATIVAVGLSRVTFNSDPTRKTAGRLVRMGIYVPYLLKEIIKSNIIIATVILHPKLPIDPQLTRVRPALWGSLPMTTLANSITLTPGTLTVRIDGRRLTVHTLVPPARKDLFDGGLERAVRFVFYGREAMHIGSLRDRGDSELLTPSGAVVGDEERGETGEDSAETSRDSEETETDADSEDDQQ